MFFITPFDRVELIEIEISDRGRDAGESLSLRAESPCQRAVLPSVGFFVRSAPEKILASPLRGDAYLTLGCCVHAFRIGEREREERREKGVGVFGASLAGWLGAAISRCGRGVHPSSVACPCCCSRSCPSGCAPGCGVHFTWLMWGFRVPRLLGCWLPGCLSPFLAVCFFPFVTSIIALKSV